MKITELFHIIETANHLYSDEFGLDGDEIIIYVNDVKYGAFRNLRDFLEIMNKEFIPSFMNQLLDCEFTSQSPYFLIGEFTCCFYKQKIEIAVNRF